MLTLGPPSRATITSQRTTADPAGQLTATMVVDRALLIDRFSRVPPLVVRDDLWGAFERRGNFRWALRAERVIGFGNVAGNGREDFRHGFHGFD